MESKYPKISVIMSAYNGQKYLREAVDSILAQTFTDFEFIIVNDGSTDQTKNILESYSDPRIILVHQENIGLTRSLNKALSLAKGEFIARQDADDVSLPSRFEEQVSYLLENRDVVLLGTGFIEIDENGNEQRCLNLPEKDVLIRWNLLFENCFCHSSVMMRATIIREQGLCYDDGMKKAQDYGFWSTLLDYGKGSNLQKPLLKYRVHNEQITIINSQEQKGFAACISKKNLNNLGFDISDTELRNIRSFHDNWYYSSSIIKIDTAALYGRIFALFLTKYSKSSDIMNPLKKRLLEKLCCSIGAGNFITSLKVGLLSVLFQIDRFFLLKHLGIRFLNKFTHGKQQTSSSFHK